MQPGEGKAQIGDVLDKTFHTMRGVPYKLYFCPCCSILFRQVDDGAEHWSGAIAEQPTTEPQ